MSGETGRTTAEAQAGTCVVWGRCVCVCVCALCVHCVCTVCALCVHCVHCVWRGEEV